jgi:hypothetical protein
LRVLGSNINNASVSMGATASGTFLLSVDTNVSIVIGGQGVNTGNGGGGGGGSFVYTATAALATPLVVGGGGGGACYIGIAAPALGGNGTLNTTGQNGYGTFFGAGGSNGTF